MAAAQCNDDSDDDGTVLGRRGARPRARATFLVADARERNVIPFFELAVRAHEFVVRQVTTGDYHICRVPPGGGPAVVLAAVERKTHTDFAASFKDGRHENLQKMLALRAATGCQLFYFLEGPAFPSPARRFTRIPFSSILTAATNMMVRHGVFLVQTEDERHSAKRLADLLVAFDEVEAPYAAAAAGGGVVAAPIDGGAADGSAEPAAPVVAADIPDILTASAVQTDAEALMLMWAGLCGINAVLGRTLSQAFSVADLAEGRVSVAAVRALRGPTGKIINKKALASLLAVREGSAEHGQRLLAGLRGVTPPTAALILAATGGLAALTASASPRALAGVVLPQKNREVKLGLARAERIWRLLRLSVTAAPVAVASIAAAPVAPAPAPAPAPEPEPIPALVLSDEDAAFLLSLVA